MEKWGLSKHVPPPPREKAGGKEGLGEVCTQGHGSPGRLGMFPAQEGILSRGGHGQVQKEAILRSICLDGWGAWMQLGKQVGGKATNCGSCKVLGSACVPGRPHAL